MDDVRAAVRQERPDPGRPRWPLFAGGAAALALCIALVFWMFRGESPSSGGPGDQGPKFDVSYIAPDFTLAVVLHPQQVFNTPPFKGLDQEKLLQGVISETGIDPRKVERVVVLLAPQTSGSATPSAAPAGASNRELRDKLVAWIKENNSRGQGDNDLPEKVGKQYDQEVRQGMAFLIKLGKGLIKSGKPTLLAGRNDALFAFDDLRPAQVVDWPTDRSWELRAAPAEKERTNQAPAIQLESFRIEPADALDLEAPISIELAFKRKSDVGHCELRMSIVGWARSATRRYDCSEDLKAEEGSLSLPVRPQPNAPQLPGELAVVFLDCCSYPSPARLDDGVVVSNTVARLVQVAGAPEDASLAPGLIVRFAEPPDRNQLFHKLLKEVRDATYDGKTYSTSTSERVGGVAMAGYMPDDRTLVMSTEPLLKKMMVGARDVQGPLVERLRSLPPDREATVVCALRAMRPLLSDGVSQARALLPLKLEEWAALPQQVEVLAASMSLKDGPFLQVVLDCAVEGSAAALEELSKTTLAWAREAYPQRREGLGQLLPPELSKCLLPILDQVQGGVEVVREGKRLTVNVKRPEGLGAAKGQ
jgi:hypothetical protein